jgi:hypothetical protein
MTTIRATVSGGRLELDVPPDWPDGIEVEIHPIEQGMADALSPEEIANALAALDRIEPFDMTEEEQASWEAERRARKDREKNEFASHLDELRRHWQ